MKIVKKKGKYAIKAGNNYMSWSKDFGIHKKGDIYLYDTKEEAEKSLMEFDKGFSQWIAIFEEHDINCELLKKRI